MQIQKTPHFTLKSSSRRKENIIENKTSFRSDIYIFEKLLQIIRSCLGTAMNGTQPTVFKWRYPFVQFEFIMTGPEGWTKTGKDSQKAPKKRPFFHTLAKCGKNPHFYFEGFPYLNKQ